MTMWNFLSPANLLDMQRKAAFGYMGEQARILLADGYPADADRMLDEMIARRARWNDASQPTGDPSEG